MNKETIETKLEGVFTPACKHDEYCYKLTTMPKSHCSEDYVKVCGRVKDFYDRYGENANHLGVGS